MEKRATMHETEPQAYKAMYALEGYLKTTQLTTTYKNLVKIRASQINGCAYCLDMHTKEAIQSGETLQRIFLLSAWRETSVFTQEEKTILALTEEVTLIHQHGVSDAVYQAAVQQVGSAYVNQLIMAIVTINAWNRIAISTNLEIGH